MKEAEARKLRMLGDICQSLLISASIVDEKSVILRAILENEGAFSYGQNVTVHGQRGILTISWEPRE